MPGVQGKRSGGDLEARFIGAMRQERKNMTSEQIEVAIRDFYTIEIESRETIVRWSAGQKEREIYTNDPSVIRRLAKLYPAEQLRDAGQLVFKVPGRCVRFARLEKRKVSEEQRQRMRERAKAMQAAKKQEAIV